ncbi:hypothetical protein JHK84_055372 [Glycine max]|nr:hypothetical protein JHK86_055335 [Glycine max]KAG4918064.1 hypothetical protein JHK85_056345 [Glycine max]KAG5074141.1 hypothetical protein JHK84_055372 [Glycine max]
MSELEQSYFALITSSRGMKLKLPRYDKVRMLGLKPLPVDAVKVVDPQRKFDDGTWEDMRKFDDKISARDYDNFQSVMFWIGPVEPRFSEWLVFEGISVDESGRQHYLDASVAYKRVVLNAIDYISKFGYSKE